MKELKVQSYQLTNKQIVQLLDKNNIKRNKYANILLNDERLLLHQKSQSFTVKKISGKEVGITSPEPFTVWIDKVHEKGYKLCPLWLAPFIRVKYCEEYSSKDNTKNQVPPNSVTILSKTILLEDDYPKGFYLVLRNNERWLRGYKCTNEYLWPPTTQFFVID